MDLLNLTNNDFVPQDIRRERIISTLRHEKSDQVPLTLGGPSCSIHRIAYDKLIKYLGFSSDQRPIITDQVLQIVEIGQRLLGFFNIDLIWLLPRTERLEWNANQTEFLDQFGRKYKDCGGFFNQVGYPLLGFDLPEIQQYSVPKIDRSRFDHLKKEALEFHKKGYGLGIDGPWGLFEICSSLVGMSNFLTDLILNPIKVTILAEKVLEEYLIPFYDLLLEHTSDMVQIVGISDDLGTQSGLLFSPKIYRKIFKPLHRRLVEYIRSKTSAHIYMHSDGSIFPIIPDLIEIGIQGLNPVQYTAKDMGLDRLINEFGRDLGFFGGVIENEILSFGTPDEIRTIVMNNSKILKRNNCFIFAPIHNVSQEVPPENIIALYHAGIEFGIY